MAKTGVGSASKSDASRVSSFTGTSTGTKYEVGKGYSTANGTVYAQADGSFYNPNTGKSSAGSREAVAEAMLYKAHTGGNNETVSDGSHGGKQTVRVAFSGGGSGAHQAATPGATREPQRGPGNPVVTSHGGFFSGVMEDLETQLMVWDGRVMNTRKDISDGGDGEQRWGEWGGALYGLAVMAADYQNMIGGEASNNLSQRQAEGRVVQNKLYEADGKPVNQSDASWLQSQLDKYAAQEALTRSHSTGLSELVGNPFEPGGFTDFGSWWR